MADLQEPNAWWEPELLLANARNLGLTLSRRGDEIDIEFRETFDSPASPKTWRRIINSHKHLLFQVLPDLDAGKDANDPAERRAALAVARLAAGMLAVLPLRDAAGGDPPGARPTPPAKARSRAGRKADGRTLDMFGGEDESKN